MGKNFHRTSADLYVVDGPDNLSDQGMKAMLDQLAAMGQPFDGTYNDALALIVSRALSGSKPEEGVRLPEQNKPAGLAEDLLQLKDSDPQQPIAEQQILQKEQAAAEEASKPKTDVPGVMGAVTRGMAPVLAGAAAGLPFGPLGVAAGALATFLGEPVTKVLEFITGKDFQSPAEGISNLLTRLGVAEPDTQAERLVEAAFRSGTATVAGGLPTAGAVAQTLGAGQSPLAAPGIVQNTLQTLSKAPAGPALAGEVAGELGTTGGANLGRRGAEAAGVENPLVKEIIAAILGVVGGGLLGGAAEGALTMAHDANMAISNRQFRNRSDAGEVANITPPTRSEINKGDFMSTERGRNQQGLGEGIRGGTMEIRARRLWENQQQMLKVFKDYGVEVDDLGSMPDFAVPLLDDFLQTRRAKLIEYTQLRDDVIAAMPNEAVPVPKASAYLTEQLDTLEQRHTPIAQQLRKEIATWEDAIEDLNFRNLNSTRADLGDALKGDDKAAIRDQAEQLLRGLYENLVEDMTDYTQQVGGDELSAMWRTSQDNLHAMAGDLNDHALKAIIEQGRLNPDNLTPEMVTRRLSSMDTSDVEKVMRSLSEEGQGIARQAFIADIAKRQDMNDLSPTQFANDLAKRANQAKVIFPPDEVQFLTGLKKWFDQTRRAEQAMRGVAPGQRGFNPNAIPAGGTMMSAGVRANFVAGAAGNIAGLIGLGKAARMIETWPQIKTMFRELADLSPGSESAMRLTRIITNALEERWAEMEEGGQPEQAPEQAPEPETTRYRWR